MVGVNNMGQGQENAGMVMLGQGRGCTVCGKRKVVFYLLLQTHTPMSRTCPGGVGQMVETGR